ncbi:MAG: HD domain-containing protein, partial [Chloroflexi bacterium]
MQYLDSIYGSEQITEPVLLDLIASKAMKRLHGVLQHGISGLIGITSAITRFDHSMGAMIVVRRLGASVEEQIAALLHDVSHTAFSHVIDYVFNDHDGQSYHDRMKMSYVIDTDIPDILAKHGYDWTDFMPEENFQLLEQPSPRLCADRLDYFLRDSEGLQLAKADDIAWVLRHLVVKNGRIATNNIDAARWLGVTFIKADDASWANFYEVGIYELTAQALRTGLQVGAITETDFWGTDEPVWAKLHAFADDGLQKQLALVSPKTKIVRDAEAADFWVSTKIRSIDPDVVVDGGIRPLSTLDPEFAKYRSDYHQRKQ